MCVRFSPIWENHVKLLNVYISKCGQWAHPSSISIDGKIPEPGRLRASYWLRWPWMALYLWLATIFIKNIFFVGYKYCITCLPCQKFVGRYEQKKKSMVNIINSSCKVMFWKTNMDHQNYNCFFKRLPV